MVANGGGANTRAQIDNYGAWAGAVDGNAGPIYNLGGTWTGAVAANTGSIVNNLSYASLNPGGVNHANWIGDVTGNAGPDLQPVGRHLDRHRAQQ